MNLLQKMIADLQEKNMDEPNAQALLALLEAKNQELGEDASEDDAAEAVRSCLAALIADQGGDAAAVDAAYMEQATKAVREVMTENEWHFRDDLARPDLHRFELGFSLENIKALKIRVYVEDNPKVCQIAASFPFLADTTLDYPLCKYMATFNFNKRFGALYYDERDGELLCRHTFPTDNGIDKVVFENLFRVILSMADEAAPDLRKYATGRFKSEEITEILNRVNKLVSELAE